MKLSLRVKILTALAVVALAIAAIAVAVWPHFEQLETFRSPGFSGWTLARSEKTTDFHIWSLHSVFEVDETTKSGTYRVKLPCLEEVEAEVAALSSSIFSNDFKGTGGRYLAVEPSELRFLVFTSEERFADVALPHESELTGKSASVELVVGFSARIVSTTAKFRECVRNGSSGLNGSTVVWPGQLLIGGLAVVGFTEAEIVGGSHVTTPTAGVRVRANFSSLSTKAVMFGAGSAVDTHLVLGHLKLPQRDPLKAGEAFRSMVTAMAIIGMKKERI